MLAKNNDLNMLLKAQVVKIRAELDLKESVPKIRKQVDEITKKLENKPVKLRVELNATISQLNEAMKKLRTKMETSKTFKPLKIRVDIDVQGSALQIKKSLQEVHRVVEDFNNKYGEQVKKMQEQVNKYNRVIGETGEGGKRSINSATYRMIEEIREAEKLLRETYSPKTGSGLFGFTEFRDAEGNVNGFIAQLEKANGVVHRIRYEWNKEAGKFTPINQQTVDNTEKHVHKATQALRTLSAEIQKLQDGTAKDSLWKSYNDLERRASQGTLTQDAVKALQTQIKEEQALQQVISRQNKEYITQQKLIDKINSIKKSMNKQAYREQVDIDNYKQLNNILKEVKRIPIQMS